MNHVTHRKASTKRSSMQVEEGGRRPTCPNLLASPQIIRKPLKGHISSPTSNVQGSPTLQGVQQEALLSKGGAPPKPD
jgi:hypothetical protein